MIANPNATAGELPDDEHVMDINKKWRERIHGEFTQWMDEKELEQRSRGWNQLHLWAPVVEGRWYGSAVQYRVIQQSIPNVRYFYWHWHYNLDGTTYAKKVQEYSVSHFELVHAQSFTTPDGSARHQAVWCKRIP